MNVIAPPTTEPGSRPCVTITGASGSISVAIEFNGSSLPYTIEEDGEGGYQVCFDAPVVDFGHIFITISDDGGSDYDGDTIEISP